jgi:anti-sigma B factor antagonist
MARSRSLPKEILTLNVPFRVDASSRDGLHAVEVHGELDQATAPELRQALANTLGDSTAPVLVDLSECGFIDSTGLSLLVETKRELADEQRRFGVCCPDDDVRRLLELTGIDEAVGLFGTRDEAVAKLRS